MSKIMHFRIAKEDIAEKLPKELRETFNTRVQYTLNILGQETMSIEGLAIIAADVVSNVK